MEKIYQVIYLMICLALLIVLIMLAKSALKALPKMLKITNTLNNTQNNLNNISKKTAYINEVKNRVFSPKIMSNLAKIYIISDIIGDYNNSKKKSVIKSISKAIK